SPMKSGRWPVSFPAGTLAPHELVTRVYRASAGAAGCWPGLRPVFSCFLLLSFGVYGPSPNPQATRCASGVLHQKFLVRAPSSLLSAQDFRGLRTPDGLMGFPAGPASFHFASRQKQPWEGFGGWLAT